MSAECFKHGCDLVYPVDSDGMVGVCQVCEQESQAGEWERQWNDAQDEIRRLHEAINLMVCEIEGIDVDYENGCKGAAIEVGMEALGYREVNGKWIKA